MSSEVKWTVFVGLPASLLAAALMALVTHITGALSLLGWLIFLESLQLPMIAAARRGVASIPVPYRMAPTRSPGEVMVTPDDRQQRTLSPRVRSGISFCVGVALFSRRYQ